MITTRYIAALFLMLFLCAPTIAHAQETTTMQPAAGLIDIIPASTLPETDKRAYDGNNTHPPIKLTPDKSELVRLDKKAGSIIVGNPEHLSVFADSASTLVLVPRAPGATYITVLDQDGELIMARHVIVASPKEKYIRIRSSCAGSDDQSCQPTTVYYCPDMCHEIRSSSDGGTSSGSVSGSNSAQAITNAQESIDTEATEE